MKKAYLYLANGQVLEGQSFGASGTAIGELVFTTGMTGCVESLTDPSYYGQLVVYTFPQFGNYGICRKDMESPHCQMGGVVVREYCQEPSNFRCDATVDTFLKEQNVVGIAGVDTRMLTQMIRDGGVMNAIITTEETKPDLEVLKTYRVEQSVENTSTKEAYDIPAQGEEKFSVALLDYGAKGSIPNSLTARGCKVTIYPYNTPAEEILAAGHDGVMLSNGPGDPADQEAQVRPPRCQPARHGPDHWLRGHHQPEPRLCRRRVHPGRDRGQATLHQRQRPHLRGRGLPRLPCLLAPVPPRSPRRPAGLPDCF